MLVLRLIILYVFERRLHNQHRYRRTILDATDDLGQPFLNHPRIFCPFHFMNEDLTRANIAFVEGYIVNQVLCMSTRTIKAGQELFVNYGDDVDRNKWMEAEKTLKHFKNQ